MHMSSLIIKEKRMPSNALFLLILMLTLLATGEGLVPVPTTTVPTTDASLRLYSTSDGGIGGEKPDKLSSTIKAAASVQSSNVFKLTRQLDEITDNYNSMLDEMELLQERAIQELEKKKSKGQNGIDDESRTDDSYEEEKDDVLYVRLVSMSPRELYIWAIDSKTNRISTSFPIASFQSAASVITTGTKGDRYVYSQYSDLEGDISNGLGIIEVSKEKETYLLYDDEAHPPTSAQLQWLEKVQSHSIRVKSMSGRTWQHYYSVSKGPREPPQHHMWDTRIVGQKHIINSNIGHWVCNKSRLEASPLQLLDTVDITIEVVSSEPKVLLIKNFLSHYECDHLIKYGKDRMKESEIGTVSTGGSKKTQHRTSSNGWIYRSEGPIVDSIYRRAAQLLKIDEALLRGHGRMEGIINAAEPLQVVNYQVGQKFDYHYDWTIGPHPHSRYLTLLLYLNDKEDADSGGETAFYNCQMDESKHDPHIIQPVRDHSSVTTGCANSDKGIKIHPGKGNAVLFYNLCEDGNGDIKSQHAALPVKKGEKWLANMWVWDPVLPDSNSFTE